MENAIPSNLYPVNSAIFLEEPTKNAQMLVMNDKPQGGTALNGRIELMFNRRVISDDQLGMQEYVNEQ